VRDYVLGDLAGGLLWRGAGTINVRMIIMGGCAAVVGILFCCGDYQSMMKEVVLLIL